MEMGKFNKALMDYDDDFLIGAYEELQVLSETGCFPTGQKYFRELADLRHSMYHDGRNNDATKKDVMNEIARRWYEGNKR
jgi:hypothetical protein